MLMSRAMRSLTVAVGVGFLLNSISSVTSWSCVARWRFWFFCCCVRVLFRGGRREGLEMEAPLGGVSVGGEAVEVDISRPLSIVVMGQSQSIRG